MRRSLADYPLEDLKNVYRTLHAQLPENMELMDSELLQDLQTLLQQKARAEGVDISVHAQWATWLNGGADLRAL
ncbi:hypothetical protein [Thiohalobacter sp.]|uniref:hypothetical protein n=1 Tax=Thiohalobacter sp. TaxID=2025948 RepID=UPI0026201500|nr:hypothetical protein [Thiohalobacter sp.]